MKRHGKAAIGGTGALSVQRPRGEECSDAVTAASPLLAFKAMTQ
jgi:hypothetical protein